MLHSRRRWLLSAAALVAWSAHADSQDSGGQPALPSVELAVGEHTLITELATSPEQRYLGLGNRRTLAEDAAMLFVYPDERMLTFTMRDTRLPLSIAFISAGLEILEIIDMDVGPGQLFPASQPAMYALEVNQGWFERHGIEAGDRVVPASGPLP